MIQYKNSHRNRMTLLIQCRMKSHAQCFCPFQCMAVRFFFSLFIFFFYIIANLNGRFVANACSKIKAMLFGAAAIRMEIVFQFEIADNGLFGRNMLFTHYMGCLIFNVTFTFGQTRFLCNFCVSF